MKVTSVEDRLLATHVSNNKDFADACQSGDVIQIMSIVDKEMDKNNLHTKGAEKLRADIVRMTRGNTKVSSYIGNGILMFVWNSRLSGTGYAVAK